MAFKIGQKVVYPNHGVSVIEKIEPTKMDGVEQTFYHLRLLSNQSKVMVPKENLELVGLRPLCQNSEIKSLFTNLRNGNIDIYKDWKGRYKQNLDKMRTGHLLEVARVLKNLRLVSSKKSWGSNFPSRTSIREFIELMYSDFNPSTYRGKHCCSCFSSITINSSHCLASSSGVSSKNLVNVWKVSWSMATETSWLTSTPRG